MYPSMTHCHVIGAVATDRVNILVRARAGPLRDEESTMRISRVAFAGVAVAAAAAAAGTAFTASNTVPDSVAGYGQGEITGVTVTDIHYVPVAADPTHLDQVVFTSTTQITAAHPTVTMTLKSSSTAVVGTPYTCSVGAWDSAAATPSQPITCVATDEPEFTGFNYVGLSVSQ